MTRFQDFLKKELLYAGMSAEEFSLIRRDIHEENRKHKPDPQLPGSHPERHGIAQMRNRKQEGRRSP